MSIFGRFFNKSASSGGGGLEEFLEKGNVAFEEGNLGEALSNYDRVLEVDPGNQSAVYNKALCLNEAERYEEALEYFSKILENSSGDPDVWDERGKSLSQLGRKKEAIESFDKALSLDPNSLDAAVNKALAYKSIGEFGNSLESFRYAQKIDSSDFLIKSEIKELENKLDVRGKDYVAESAEALDAFRTVVQDPLGSVEGGLPEIPPSETSNSNVSQMDPEVEEGEGENNENKKRFAGVFWGKISPRFKMGVLGAILLLLLSGGVWYGMIMRENRQEQQEGTAIAGKVTGTPVPTNSKDKTRAVLTLDGLNLEEDVKEDLEVGIENLLNVGSLEYANYCGDFNNLNKISQIDFETDRKAIYVIKDPKDLPYVSLDSYDIVDSEIFQYKEGRMNLKYNSIVKERSAFLSAEDEFGEIIEEVIDLAKAQGDDLEVVLLDDIINSEVLTEYRFLPKDADTESGAIASIYLDTEDNIRQVNYGSSSEQCSFFFNKIGYPFDHTTLVEDKVKKRVIPDDIYTVVLEMIDSVSDVSSYEYSSTAAECSEESLVSASNGVISIQRNEKKETFEITDEGTLVEKVVEQVGNNIKTTIGDKQQVSTGDFSHVMSLISRKLPLYFENTFNESWVDNLEVNHATKPDVVNGVATTKYTITFTYKSDVGKEVRKEFIDAITPFSITMWIDLKDDSLVKIIMPFDNCNVTDYNFSKLNKELFPLSDPIFLDPTKEEEVKEEEKEEVVINEPEFVL